MVADAIIATPMYPWVAHRRRLLLQYIMVEVPVHYYGWIRHNVYLETTHGLDFKTPISPAIIHIAVTILTRRIHICKKALCAIFD